jgi:gliding motility-associated-like protein
MDTLHFTNQFLCDSQIIIKTLLAESHFIRKETQSCHPQDTGLFQTNFTNAFGCDSIIATSVKLASTVECQFRFTATGSNICQDQRLGSINIEIEAGTPPFRYFIFRENGADTLANGFINALQTPIIVDNIEIGRHQVYIQNQHHILSIQTVEIKRSPPIQLTAQISDYNGLPISCADAADGHISLSINGGMPPYSILWNNMETGNALQNLTAGTYAMTLTDAFNCSLSESFTLNEKDSLSTDYQIIRDLCSKETFGKISIDSIYHAHGQASYSLDGILFEPVGNLPLRLDNLVPGDNQFFIKDENNCQHIEPFHIHPPSQISLNLGSDTTLSLGENIILKPIANFDIARFEWSSNLPLNCTDCSELSIEANTNAFYHLTAYDENDCAISDTVQIQVKKETALYLPNAFSPNEDGHNDVYQIYSKPAVRLIKTFQIVDSEGRLMYQADNKLPNEADLGWDGQFNGQAMLPAVFIVFVEIELIDGSVESFVQTINLVK